MERSSIVNKIRDLTGDTNGLIDFLYDHIQDISIHISEYINVSARDSITHINGNSVTMDTLTDIDDMIATFKIAILSLCNSRATTELDESEFAHPKHSMKYLVTVCNNELNEKLFILFTYMYYIESAIRYKYIKNFEKHSVLGVDCEFNSQTGKKKIALIQLNFEMLPQKERFNNYIFIISPSNMNKDNLKTFIDLVLCNELICKIFHGCDAQDLPHIYDEILNDDDDLITKFTNSIIDTRFICEYYKMSVGNEKICTIYKALQSFNIITDEKYQFLENTHESMGPVQDIAWNINKMSTFHAKYAVYDVIYLKYLVCGIINLAIGNSHYHAYIYIPFLTRFNFIEKKNITNVITTIKNDIDPINNYIVRFNDKNYTLISIFDKIIIDVTLEKTNIHMKYICGVNVLKGHFIMLLKKVVYHLICDNYPVWMNKKQRYNNRCSIDILRDMLKTYKYDKILVIVDDMIFTLKKSVKRLKEILST
jgi:hypothetical protein